MATWYNWGFTKVNRLSFDFMVKSWISPYFPPSTSGVSVMLWPLQGTIESSRCSGHIGLLWLTFSFFPNEPGTKELDFEPAHWMFPGKGNSRAQVTLPYPSAEAWGLGELGWRLEWGKAGSTDHRWSSLRRGAVIDLQQVGPSLNTIPLPGWPYRGCSDMCQQFHWCRSE